MSSIFLHPTLGVNPRMLKIHCQACGKTVNDSLVLLGRSNYKETCCTCGVIVYGGVRTSTPCPKCGSTQGRGRTELSDYESIERNGICSECQELMKQGIILVSVRKGKENDNPYRTGGWVVVKEEALRRLLKPGELLESICKRRLSFVPDDAWQTLGLPRKDPSDVQAN